MNGLSPFLHRYLVAGEEILFHSLTLELYSSLQECPSAREENRLIVEMRKKAALDKGIVMTTLFLTTACPRKCGYCFLQGTETVSMTRAEIDRALELTGTGPADLLLYGGEPLLRPDLILHTIEQISHSGALVNIILSTGGMKTSSATADALASAGAFVIVSIDGPPDIHNGNRPMTHGGDSFSAAEESFRSFRAAGCRCGISVTLTRDGVHRASESFLYLLERFKPDDMGLNPWMHPLPGGVANPFQVDGDQALKAVTHCMELAIDRGMYIEQLARRVRPFVNRTPRLKDCASAGGRLVAMGGGIAGICDCLTSSGDQRVDLYDTQAVTDLMSEARRLSPVNFPDCAGCPALCLCGGGCRYDAFHSSGVIDGVRQERCEFERGFLRWMIERTVRKGRESLVPSGGFRDEKMPMPVGTMLGEDRGEG